MFSLTQNYLTRGFWGDEAWTSLISQLPYVQMLKTTAADFHPPGYYTIIEILYKFVAPTEVNTRLVSIVFYLLTIYLVYKLASFAHSKNFGILSAVVVAINPIFSALGIYTHYYMFFVLAAEFLYVLLFDRKILFATIVAYFVVALLYLPWIPF